MTLTIVEQSMTSRCAETCDQEHRTLVTATTPMGNIKSCVISNMFLWMLNILWFAWSFTGYVLLVGIYIVLYCIIIWKYVPRFISPDIESQYIMIAMNYMIGYCINSIELRVRVHLLEQLWLHSIYFSNHLGPKMISNFILSIRQTKVSWAQVQYNHCISL